MIGLGERTRTAGGTVEWIAGVCRARDPPNRAAIGGIVHTKDMRAVHTGRALGKPLGRTEVACWGCSGLRLREEGGSREEECEGAGVR